MTFTSWHSDNCHVQRGLAVDILRIDIGAKIYQQFNVTDLFVNSREVEWSCSKFVILGYFEVMVMS